MAEVGEARPPARRWPWLAVAAVLGLVLAAELLASRYLADTWGFVRPDDSLGWSYRPGHRAYSLVFPGAAA